MKVGEPRLKNCDRQAGCPVRSLSGRVQCSVLFGSLMSTCWYLGMTCMCAALVSCHLLHAPEAT